MDCGRVSAMEFCAEWVKSNIADTHILFYLKKLIDRTARLVLHFSPAQIT